MSVLAIPFVTSSQAQLLTDTTITGGYTTIASYIGGSDLTDGGALTQTFTGATSIDTVTFRFTAAAPTGAPTSMDVYFSEWSGSDATSSIGVGTFALPAAGTWINDAGFYYYDMAFDLTSVAGSLTALTTYGLTVVGNTDTAAGGYRLGLGDGSYASGGGFTHSSVTSFSDLTSSGGAFGGGDYAFIADSAAGYDAFAPVPEASTVAVIFAGVFVGLMVGVRIRQRRQQAALPAQV